MGKEEDDRWIEAGMGILSGPAYQDDTEQGGVVAPPAFSGNPGAGGISIPKGSMKALHHKRLLDGLHDTFVRKNHDYGDSFAETFKEFGIISFIVRAQDKWNRIKSLSHDHKNARVAESLQDTLLDLANYCIMAAMELEGK